MSISFVTASNTPDIAARTDAATSVSSDVERECRTSSRRTSPRSCRHQPGHRFQRMIETMACTDDISGAVGRLGAGLRLTRDLGLKRCISACRVTRSIRVPGRIVFASTKPITAEMIEMTTMGQVPDADPAEPADVAMPATPTTSDVNTSGTTVVRNGAGTARRSAPRGA